MPSLRWRLRTGSPTDRHRFRCTLLVVLALGSAWALLIGTPALASAPPSPSGPPTSSAGSSGAGSTAVVPPPTLVPLLLAQPLPGFTAAVAGPTNGTLTATEFASQSSDPAQAQRQFDDLAATPGFAASIRLWTDRAGPGAGANDVAILLFRIDDRSAAATFATGLHLPFAGASGSTPFAVPSIPGARGYSVVVTNPVPAVERVVVFRAGRYVALVELASTSASTNPVPLTPAQAVAVSYLQFSQVRAGDPTGTVDTPVATIPPRSAPSSNGVTSASAGGSSPAMTVVAVVLVALIIGLIVLLVLSLRRRTEPAVPTGAAVIADQTKDPWAPGGVFAALAGLTGDEAAHEGVDPDSDVETVLDRDGVPPPEPEMVAPPEPEMVATPAPPMPRMVYPTRSAASSDPLAAGSSPLPVPALVPTDAGATDT